MRAYEFIDEAAGVGRIVKGVNTTPDVQPGEIKRQAEKFGFDVTADGEPPRISSDSNASKKKKRKQSK